MKYRTARVIRQIRRAGRPVAQAYTTGSIERIDGADDGSTRWRLASAEGTALPAGQPHVTDDRAMGRPPSSQLSSMGPDVPPGQRADGRRTRRAWRACWRPGASASTGEQRSVRAVPRRLPCLRDQQRLDRHGGIRSFADPKVYVVQTNTKVIERCMLMTTDPGDLVLDPTCGSGTTAYVAEQWGRRWITDRHVPRRAGAGPDAADVRSVPVLPAGGLGRGRGQGGGAHRAVRRRPGHSRATSARGSSTSGCPTSR